ncbi:uncharacterized protein BDV14DRAFT_139121 [Aspergillus stella-maris]|uniref:uncharacterized protein n=1 Tax=Aspergillus stella-maris TaxID=1810926 RepID=UPI003CCE4390
MRPLLLTLDAFNTLFHPRQPIPLQYASSAANFNIHLSPAQIQPAFRASFKALSASHPNYGRDLALRGEYAGPRQWWEDVIRGCFSRALESNPDSKGQGKADVPDALIQHLLERFASKRGYKLYDDVEPFFRKLRTRRMNTGSQRKVGVGVVSNSDDRISPVLESLGVSVREARAGEVKTRQGHDLPGFEEERERQKSSTSTSPGQGREQKDLDFILTSYQAGVEKPDRLIWDTALRTAQQLEGQVETMTESEEWERIHVGDDYSKDYRGAEDAGWKAYHLPREQESAEAPKGTRTITSLLDLLPEIEGA